MKRYLYCIVLIVWAVKEVLSNHPHEGSLCEINELLAVPKITRQINRQITAASRYLTETSFNYRFIHYGICIFKKVQRTSKTLI